MRSIREFACEMGLSVEDQKAARVAMMKEKYSAIILKAQQVLSDNAKASEKDRCVVEKKKRPLGKENKISAEDQESCPRRPFLAAKKPQESKGFMVKRPRETDVPKFMTFNDPKRVAEVVQEAEARLMKRQRQREIERQREAARIAINNVTKTVDFDNLGVMKEFEKLMGPRASDYAYGSLLVM